MTFRKTAVENLDYQIDWSLWLGTDTINTSTWTIDSGLTKGLDLVASNMTTVWLSGGVAGSTYVITNAITTFGGRTAQRSFIVVLDSQL